MKKQPKERNYLDYAETPIVTCQRCKNVYIVIWLNQGKDFNDFGDRHCPLCGLITEEFCLPVEN